MSWYSRVYTYVRDVRRRRPILGLLLHASLNILLVLQLIGIGLSYYVYTYVVCGKMLTSYAQVCFYLAVYNTLYLMMFWSMIQTLRTPVAQVPDNYKADADLDKKIKEATPLGQGRYMPDESSKKQVEIQKRLLYELVQKNQINVAEVDHLHRYRYCYECGHLKPDRCHHCNSCGFCVLKFDHHCPLVNKCINYANYKFFVLYIFYGCLIIGWSLLTSFEALVRYFVNHAWISELHLVLQVTISMAVSAMFGYYPLGELLIYHFQLISENETTCEQIKEPIILGDDYANYNLGRYHNFRSVFGWGLWLFPVNTAINDGIRFPVNYSEYCDQTDTVVVKTVNERTLESMSSTDMSASEYTRIYSNLDNKLLAIV